MIVITVELWRGGDKRNKEVLGIGIIANDGAGTAIEGNYKYQIFGKKNVPLRAGKVTGFPRKQLLGWDLLCRVLKQAFGDRN